MFWQSGQKGAFLKFAEPAESKITTPLKSTTKVQILTDNNDDAKPAVSPSNKKGSYCGEWGKNSHSLTRNKTGVPVGKECYSKFTKVKTKQPRTCITEGNKAECKVTSAKPIANTEAITNGGSLLDGTYDEEANAASFAEALAEWRNGNKTDASTTDKDLGNSASCQTTISKQKTNVVPEFHTSGSVTYLERLMIRRNRCDPKFLPNTVGIQKASTTLTSSINSSTVDKTDTVVPSPYNVFYEAPLEQWNTPNSDTSASILNNNTSQPRTNADEDSSTDLIKPLAMQMAIREAWASKGDIVNLSQFFVSGVDENETLTCVSEHQDDEKPQDLMLGRTTETWKPEQSVVRNCDLLKPHNENFSDSDDSDDALDLMNCESDKEEWEMDDRITLECLERELQASQLGSNPKQEHQEINNHNSDFEETEIQKNEQ